MDGPRPLCKSCLAHMDLWLGEGKLQLNAPSGKPVKHLQLVCQTGPGLCHGLGQYWCSTTAARVLPALQQYTRSDQNQRTAICG
jgi:hypothetical protein